MSGSGRNQEERIKWGREVLVAVRDGNLNGLQNLLGEGFANLLKQNTENVDELNQYFQTIINKALGSSALASNGDNSQIKILDFLLNNGADINATINGRSPLQLAMLPDANNEYSGEGARFLIDKGANVHFVDYRGWTAVMYAEDNIHKHPSMRGLKKHLIQKGSYELDALPYEEELKNKGFILKERYKIHVGGAVGLYEYVGIDGVKNEEVSSLCDENGCLVLKTPVIMEATEYEFERISNLTKDYRVEKGKVKIFFDDSMFVDGKLKYIVLDSAGKRMEGVILRDKLPDGFPTDVGTLIGQKDIFISDILNLTYSNGHTMSAHDLSNQHEFFEMFKQEAENTSDLSEESKNQKDLLIPKIKTDTIRLKDGTEIPIILNERLVTDKTNNSTKNVEQYFSELGGSHKNHSSVSEDEKNKISEIFLATFQQMHNSISQFHAMKKFMVMSLVGIL